MLFFCGKYLKTKIFIKHAGVWVRVGFLLRLRLCQFTITDEGDAPNWVKRRWMNELFQKLSFLLTKSIHLWCIKALLLLAKIKTRSKCALKYISCKTFISLQWIWQDVVLGRSPSYFQTRCTIVLSEVVRATFQMCCPCSGCRSSLLFLWNFENVPVENCWCIRGSSLPESLSVLLVFDSC